MICKPNFIIIGSSSRNTGKTEFAVRLISRYAKTNRVFGLKVKSLDKKAEPLSTEDDGVIRALPPAGDFIIFEETATDGRKDTSRMLAAGAEKVYFLKVFSANEIAKAVAALLRYIPDDVAVVCESNALRCIVEPGVFLVIKNENDPTTKPNYDKVEGFADKIVSFKDLNWDFQPSRITLKSNHWIIREKATAIVLAGGKSSRMGEDKSFLSISGKPLIEHVVGQLQGRFDEIIIGANDQKKYGFLGHRIVPDEEDGKGPLMGIYSCLRASGNEVNFVTACDIPVMNSLFIVQMLCAAKDVDIVMPVSDENKYEPLYAVYNKSVIPEIEKLLKMNCYKVARLIDHARVKLVEFENDSWYENLNKKAEFKKFVENGTNLDPASGSV